MGDHASKALHDRDAFNMAQLATDGDAALIQLVGQIVVSIDVLSEPEQVECPGDQMAIANGLGEPKALPTKRARRSCVLIEIGYPAEHVQHPRFGPNVLRAP